MVYSKQTLKKIYSFFNTFNVKCIEKDGELWIRAYTALPRIFIGRVDLAIMVAAELHQARLLLNCKLYRGKATLYNLEGLARLVEYLLYETEKLSQSEIKYYTMVLEGIKFSLK